jgi:hypothetical protein
LTLPADEVCEFLAVPTNQHAVEDLVAIGDKIEQEKDRCLNVFMEFANDFCRKLQQAGYWAGVCLCLTEFEFVCVEKSTYFSSFYRLY